jgi:hypothetical protein
MSRHAIPIWWTFGSGVLFSAGREFFGCSASSRTSCFELPKDFSANEKVARRGYHLSRE